MIWQAPPGLLLSMIRNHDLVPQDFLTTSKANLAYRRQAPSRVEREQAECEFKEHQLKAEYNEYCDGLSKQFIQTKRPEAGAREITSCGNSERTQRFCHRVNGLFSEP